MAKKAKGSALARSLPALMGGLSEARRREVERRAQEKIAAVRLQRLREERAVSQAELAKRLGITQSTLSRLERRPNVTLATLVQYVEALGGTVHIEASFGERVRRDIVGARGGGRRRPGRVAQPAKR